MAQLQRCLEHHYPHNSNLEEEEVSVVTAALVLILFIISVTNLHLLFLQSIVAQQLDQELPAPNETKQVPNEGNQTEIFGGNKNSIRIFLPDRKSYL